MKEFIFLTKNIFKTTHLIKPISFIALLFFAITVMSSCVKKAPFQVSPVVPAAEGWVKVKKDNSNNYKIEVNVEQLADPKRLSPPRNIYAVWIDTEQNGQLNIGQIKPKGGLFTKSVNSSLNTLTTPYKPIVVFITAEDNINIKQPDNQIILKTDTLYYLWE